MKRPDQDRFDQHARHFDAIDQELERFCREQGFELVRNMYRTPCRVLRRLGNPQLIIDIYQDEHWYNIDYREDMSHTFAVAGYYEPPQDDAHVFKIAASIAEHQPFSEIIRNLNSYLSEGLELLNSLTPEVILQEGQRWEKFKENKENAHSFDKT